MSSFIYIKFIRHHQRLIQKAAFGFNLLGYEIKKYALTRQSVHFFPLAVKYWAIVFLG